MKVCCDITIHLKNQAVFSLSDMPSLRCYWLRLKAATKSKCPQKWTDMKSKFQQNLTRHKFQYYRILRCRRAEKYCVKTRIFSNNLYFTLKTAPLKIPEYWNFARQNQVCKLLTDKTIKTINKKYSCQVVLEQRAAAP